MEQTTVYIIVTIMLLGAFLIGIFFGANCFANTAILNKEASNKTNVRTKNEELNSLKEDAAPVQHRARLTLDDLQPGGIRATNTRDRAGSLTKQARQEIVNSKLDWERIGKGNSRQADDFQKIVGIGPFVEEKLNDIGIYNYKQLANMTEHDMETITTLIEFFPDRILRDDWRGQAQELISKK